jgi:hypothetical protein
MCTRCNTRRNSPALRDDPANRRADRWQRFRNALGSLLDPELWLRAVAIASLREDGIASNESEILAQMFPKRASCPPCRPLESANEGALNEQSKITETSSDSCSPTALAVGDHRAHASSS